MLSVNTAKDTANLYITGETRSHAHPQRSEVSSGKSDTSLLCLGLGFYQLKTATHCLFFLSFLVVLLCPSFLSVLLFFLFFFAFLPFLSFCFSFLCPSPPPSMMFREHLYNALAAVSPLPSRSRQSNSEPECSTTHHWLFVPFDVKKEKLNKQMNCYLIHSISEAEISLI